MNFSDIGNVTKGKIKTKTLDSIYPYKSPPIKQFLWDTGFLGQSHSLPAQANQSAFLPLISPTFDLPKQSGESQCHNP